MIFYRLPAIKEYVFAIKFTYDHLYIAMQKKG